jgi:SnoaL-like polyketide cyclase
LDLLSEEFVFRGSLGFESRGRETFLNYVQSVRNSLANYRCEILDCVAEENKACAKMRFSGMHVATFRSYSPTGMPVDWLGAALLVAVLWEQKKYDAAVRLEQLWNELALMHSFYLCCAYPASEFQGELKHQPYAAICTEHTDVVYAF